LNTDPVPVAPNQQPTFDTELVWDVDAKTLRYLKSQRQLIKLQCFFLLQQQQQPLDRADLTVRRDLVGWAMLDLRQAAADVLSNKEKWYYCISFLYLLGNGFYFHGCLISYCHIRSNNSILLMLVSNNFILF
jgi:hypothetical protein